MSVFEETVYIDPAFGFDISDIGDGISDAGKWVGGAAETVGGAVADITEGVGKITIAPYTLVEKIAQGVPIDKALGRTLEEQIKVVHDIAPYAQIVISIVPGIGPIASGAISAGLALAQGQTIDEVLIAGVKGAIPGGPLAAAALEAAVQIAQGKNVGEVALSQVGNVLNGVGIPIPPQASTAIGAGLNVAQDMVAGKPLDAALLNEAVKQLTPEAKQLVQAAEAEGNLAKVADLLVEHGADAVPDLSPDQLDAMKKALSVGSALGTGQRVQAQLWSADGKLDPNAMRAQLEAALVKQKAQEKEDARWQKMIDNDPLSGGRNGSPKVFLDWYIKQVELARPGVKFPKPPQTALKNLPTAKAWANIQTHIIDGTASKLEKTIDIAEKAVLRNAIRRGTAKTIAVKPLAPVVVTETAMSHGAKLAETLMKKHFSKQEFINLRATLTGDMRKGFDLAISNAIGQRMTKAPAGLTPDEKEAYYIVKGMQGAPVQAKADMMQTIIDTGNANGAVAAVKEVAAARMTVWERIKHFLGL